MNMIERTPTKLAYFYPFSRNDEQRHLKATAQGITVVDESLLVQNGVPLFEGHKAPKRYSTGENGRTQFDNAEMQTMENMLVLANRANVGLNFCTYVGTQRGETVKEWTDSLRIFVERNERAPFVLSSVVHRSRVMLPIAFGEKDEEGQRKMDLNVDTATALLDYAEPYFNDPNYLRVNGKPYLGVINFKLKTVQRQINLIDYLGILNELALKRFGGVHLVGVTRNMEDIPIWIKGGVDAITAYCYGPDFDNTDAIVQDYEMQMERAMEKWREVANSFPKNGVQVYPSIPTDWDASSRAIIPKDVLSVPVADRPKVLKKYRGFYPLLPLMSGSSPELFEKYLMQAMRLAASTTTPNRTSIVNIFAMNEITEGGSLLPTVRADGTLDYGYLDAARNADTFLEKKYEAFCETPINVRRSDETVIPNAKCEVAITGNIVPIESITLYDCGRGVFEEYEKRWLEAIDGENGLEQHLIELLEYAKSGKNMKLLSSKRLKEIRKLGLKLKSCWILFDKTHYASPSFCDVIWALGKIKDSWNSDKIVDLLEDCLQKLKAYTSMRTSTSFSPDSRERINEYLNKLIDNIRLHLNTPTLSIERFHDIRRNGVRHVMNFYQFMSACSDDPDLRHTFFLLHEIDKFFDRVNNNYIKTQRSNPITGRVVYRFSDDERSFIENIFQQIAISEKS